MIKILENFEIMAVNFPIYLLLPIGIFTFIIGLCISFGSYKKSKPMIYALTILLITVITYIASKNKITIAAFAAVIALIIAFRSEKIFIAMVSAILVSICIAGFAINNKIDSRPYFYKPAAEPTNRFCMSDTKEILNNWYNSMNARIKNAFSGLNAAAIAIIISGFVVTAAIGIYLPPIAKLLCSSLIGSVSLSLGVILFLWFILMTPFAFISNHKIQSAVYFLGLAIFSIAIQLLRYKFKPDLEEQTKKNSVITEQPAERMVNSWRAN